MQGFIPDGVGIDYSPTEQKWVVADIPDALIEAIIYLSINPAHLNAIKQD